MAKILHARLGLTDLRLVLSARPPHRDPVPVEHRWQMLRLACEEHSWLHADDREVRRAEASYTVDTLANQRRQAPYQPLYWVIGMDSLLSFRSWYRWWRILDLAHLVVVPRPGYPLRMDTTLRSIMRRRGFSVSANRPVRDNRPPGVAGRILLLDDPMLPVSSTEIRQQLRTKGGRAPSVLPRIADYIEQQGLYSAPTEAKNC